MPLYVPPIKPNINNPNIMEEEDEVRLSVVDVYDIATDIGKEFEKIIARYGENSLNELMPKIITALEELEKVAEKLESSAALIEELRSNISVLEHQQIGQAEYRKRYVQDLEDIERDMQEEKQELSLRVTQLLDENRKLSTCLARSTDNTPSVTDDESSLEPDTTTVTKLQDSIEAQRQQVHRLQQQLRTKLQENEQLSTQIDRLTQTNKDLRRRSRQNNQQIRQLVEERAELHVTLQEQQRTVDQLQQRLGLAAKENFDLATAVQSEVSDLSTKLVYDRNDPNRPRFTLTELKDILYQRNELKARVSDLEDELSVFRPTKQQYVIVPYSWEHDSSNTHHCSSSVVCGCRGSRAECCCEVELSSGSSSDSRESPPLDVWEDYCCSTLDGQGMCGACGAAMQQQSSLPCSGNVKYTNECGSVTPGAPEALLAELRAALRADRDVLRVLLKSAVLCKALLPLVRGLEVLCSSCNRQGTVLPMEDANWAPLFKQQNLPHDTFVKNLKQFVEVREVTTLVQADQTKAGVEGSTIKPAELDNKDSGSVSFSSLHTAGNSNRRRESRDCISEETVKPTIFDEAGRCEGPKLFRRESEDMRSMDCCSKFNATEVDAASLPLYTPAIDMPDLVLFAPYLPANSSPPIAFCSSSPSQLPFPLSSTSQNILTSLFSSSNNADTSIQQQQNTFPGPRQSAVSSGKTPRLPPLLCMNCCDLRSVSTYLSSIAVADGSMAGSRVEDDSWSSSRDTSLSSGVSSSDSAVELTTPTSCSNSNCSSVSRCGDAKSSAAVFDYSSRALKKLVLRVLTRLYRGIDLQHGVGQAIGDTAVLFVSIKCFLSLILFCLRVLSREFSEYWEK